MLSMSMARVSVSVPSGISHACVFIVFKKFWFVFGVNFFFFSFLVFIDVKQDLQWEGK